MEAETQLAPFDRYQGKEVCRREKRNRGVSPGKTKGEIYDKKQYRLFVIINITINVDDFVMRRLLNCEKEEII